MCSVTSVPASAIISPILKRLKRQHRFWSLLLMTCRVSKKQQKELVRLPRTTSHFGPDWRIQYH
jgi:hypothetical protein